MGSLIEELQRREAAARAEAEELRARIEQLSQQLACAEERISRVVIAREEVAGVLGRSGVGAEAGEEREEPVEDRPGQAGRFGRGSPIGALSVPPWRAGMTADRLPVSYQAILEAYADAAGPIRAVNVAEALGLSTGRSAVEGLRSKLKRLVERGWLAEEGGPGLYVLPKREIAAEIPEVGR